MKFGGFSFLLAKECRKLKRGDSGHPQTHPQNTRSLVTCLQRFMGTPKKEKRFFSQGKLGRHGMMLTD
jgi:hypothetical protein